jgi:hypothetical protein
VKIEGAPPQACIVKVPSQACDNNNDNKMWRTRDSFLGNQATEQDCTSSDESNNQKSWRTRDHMLGNQKKD